MFQHSSGTRKPHGIPRTVKSAEIILVFVKLRRNKILLPALNLRTSENKVTSVYFHTGTRPQGQKTWSSAICPQEKSLKL